ncbi:L-seryl-tRNA(Sec) selenium transferase [Dehalogenimonas etheniformans]|uniref:L-seryl-tRNA(Sec) selenium transferase n=1 Tax=Dehalogenimonas etheniformans TaxID=1536648 RepID=A0A2P5P6L2_9CHLR|nr:L-seryl-tRNA(Sec) selenium transferase [Dehalogenimonas etheniformans]PPD57920.1 L-seryl-tRNA(Sec) selenium transferase [Dehalogenimonas etheniformans]QNT75428.1 L-seryl-tRNA(Sec) selenium transferase [Dehalogenimonas etheniformans]
MPNENQSELRKLPSVEKVLSSPELAADIERYSHPVVTATVREIVDKIRDNVSKGGQTPPLDAILEMVKYHLIIEWPGLLEPVINATGIILHTNLGRAPLSAAAVEVLSKLLGGYYALELDLATGERGVRAQSMEKLLQIANGAESALVVNNNAAAVLLVLSTLAKGREVIVSRGELVQIGGGFRVPEVMAASGAILREVGTTNQTFIRDFETAVSDQTAMLLAVHRSNFAIRGFTHDASLPELKELAKQFDLPLIYDLGSGAIIDTATFGMTHEPTIGEALASGADIVCISGDKLFGGPQCGIILGKKFYVDRLRRNPLLRALRIDKYAAIALTATVLQYLKGQAAELPVYRMMGETLDNLTRRADVLVENLATADFSAEVTDGESLAGGGSLPDETLPTRLVVVAVKGSMDEFCRKLRLGTPPVMGCVREGKFVIDLRTVFPDQDTILVNAIADAGKSKH